MCPVLFHSLYCITSKTSKGTRKTAGIKSFRYSRLLYLLISVLWSLQLPDLKSQSSGYFLYPRSPPQHPMTYLYICHSLLTWSWWSPVTSNGFTLTAPCLVCLLLETQEHKAGTGWLAAVSPQTRINSAAPKLSSSPSRLWFPLFKGHWTPLITQHPAGSFSR